MTWDVGGTVAYIGPHSAHAESDRSAIIHQKPPEESNLWSLALRRARMQRRCLLGIVTLMRRHRRVKDAHTTEISPDRNAITERDRVLQVLSLEYETARAELLMRSSARYQFLGFTTAAAALLGSGIGHPALGLGTWILGSLAAGVFILGLASFWWLGRDITYISARVADIEHRINEIVPMEPGAPKLLSWESDHQHRTKFERFFLGLPSLEAKTERPTREWLAQAQTTRRAPTRRIRKRPDLRDGYQGQSTAL
jgi:hypothetical protein